MKKGFTLIELLAVIIILAIVAVIATPMVLNVVDDAKNSARDSKLKMYADNVKLKAEGNYFTNNGKIDGEIDVSTINNNSTTCAKAYYINGGVYLGNCTIDGVDGLYYVNGNIETTSTNYDNAIADKVIYKDNSGANIPDLFNNMVAVKYTGTDWVVADTTTEWYDYDAKEWANAVVLNTGVSKNVGDIINVETEVSQMYVWIPRYKYTIFNDTADTTGVPVQEIQIAFEKNKERTGTVNCTDSIGTKSTSEDCTDINGTITKGISTYTHPAFKLGDTELTGIWVGKFENSNIIACTATDGSISTDCDLSTLGIQIKPSVTSWRGARVGTFYTAINNIATQNSMLNSDSHMMKNMEWGAMAYFTGSKYGLSTIEVGTNNNSDYLTGCGAVAGSAESTNCDEYNTTNGLLASTTGNVYGIYDISGGAWEYVMGNLATSAVTPIVGYNTLYNSGFNGIYYDETSAVFELEFPNSKYNDLYSYDASTYEMENWNTQSRGKLGDATKETMVSYGNAVGGWHEDYAIFPHSYLAWFVRGGCYKETTNTGAFFFSNCYSSSAIDGGSRTVLSRI